MRIDYVNQQIMDAMLADYTEVRYEPMPPADPAHPRYIVCTDGHVAYVLDAREIYFNLQRCQKAPDAFAYLHKQTDDTLISLDNMLTPTRDIRVAKRKLTLDTILRDKPDCRMLTRFKGAAWDTFVDMDLLEAFDDAKYYQARKNGIIAVVEQGVLVGYVMPCKADDAEGHYTDSPTYEDAETPA